MHRAERENQDSGLNGSLVEEEEGVVGVMERVQTDEMNRRTRRSPLKSEAAMPLQMDHRAADWRRRNWPPPPQMRSSGPY